MSHVYHDNLPGFHADTIWYDGCDECEDRASRLPASLSSLDHQNFRQAWADMLAEKWSGGLGTGRNLSNCDWKILNALYTFAVVMERATGTNPHDTLAAIDARFVQFATWEQRA